MLQKRTTLSLLICFFLWLPWSHGQTTHLTPQEKLELKTNSLESKSKSNVVYIQGPDKSFKRHSGKIMLGIGVMFLVAAAFAYGSKSKD